MIFNMAFFKLAIDSEMCYCESGCKIRKNQSMFYLFKKKSRENHSQNRLSPSESTQYKKHTPQYKGVFSIKYTLFFE